MSYGQVLIRPVRPTGDGVWFDLAGPTEISGGSGGWQDVTRPMRRTASEWTGTPILTQTVPLLLDGLPAGAGRNVSVEPLCRLLQSWGEPTEDTGRPPILRIAGPVHHTARRWVIDSLTWAPALRNGRGERIQQDVTLVLRDFLDPAILRGPAEKSRKRRKKK